MSGAASPTTPARPEPRWMFPATGLGGRAARSLLAWFTGAPATVAALTMLSVGLGLGAYRAVDRYLDVVSWGDGNVRYIARHAGMLDAANVLAELSDAAGEWRLYHDGGRLKVARGGTVRVPLQVRNAKLADGTQVPRTSYVLSEGDGAKVVVAEARGTTRQMCVVLGLNHASAYTRRRLDLGVSTARAGGISWVAMTGDRPSILRACAELPDGNAVSTDADAVFLRASPPRP